MPSSENRDHTRAEEAWNYFEDRFGVSKEDLENHKILKKSGDFWLTSDADEPGLKYETEGVRFLRDTGSYLKPTTYGLQILNDKISRNVVELDEEDLLTLLDGDMIEREMREKGYVALIYQGEVIGCGLYKDGLVSSRVPKGRGKELRQLL